MNGLYLLLRGLAMLVLFHLKLVAIIDALPIQLHQQHLADLAAARTYVTIGHLVVVYDPSHLKNEVNNGSLKLQK